MKSPIRGHCRWNGEDNDMDRYHGAKESLEFIRKLEFPASEINGCNILYG